MKAKDGVYTGFLILEEKDILELKHMIKNYKPISQNDIAFLHHKLKKKGKIHLVKFFENHIMGKSGSQKHVEISQPKKKEKPSIEKVVYQTKKYKASDFQFLHKQIRVGKYILKTERAFALPTSLLQKIQGEFTVRVRPDKIFYFENQGLTKLLDSVENYCYSYLDIACETWFREELDSIEKNVKRHICLYFKDFTFNEKSGRYELKDDAIKYSILSNWILEYKFQDFVDKRTNIPQKYRNTYKCNYRFAKLVDEFNKEFEKNLTDILRKYIYYTEKDLEVIKWYGENYYKPSIFVVFKLTDEILVRA